VSDEKLRENENITFSNLQLLYHQKCFKINLIPKSDVVVVTDNTVITTDHDAIHYVWQFETIWVLENLANGSPNFFSGGGFRWPFVFGLLIKVLIVQCCLHLNAFY